MHHSSLALGYAVPLFLLACGSPPEPASPLPPPGPTRTPAVPPGPSAPLPAPAPAPQAAQPKSEASPFSVLAVGESGELQLYSMGNAVFFGDTNYLAEARGDELVERQDLLGKMNLGSDQFLQSLIGTWPGDTWAVVTTPGGCSPGTSSLLHFTKDKWVRAASTTGTYFGAAPWQNGSVLLLGGYYIDVKFSLAAGRAGLKAPRLPRSKGAPDSAPFVSEAMAALPSGDTFVLGTATNGDKTVAHWTPGNQEPKLDGLPSCGGPQDRLSPEGLVVRNDKDAYVFGVVGSGVANAVGYLARFDGTDWKCEKTPPSSNVSRLALGPDGSVWLVLDQAKTAAELWRRPGGGEWQKVAMPEYTPQGGRPEQFRPAAVHVNGPDDIWLTGHLAPSTDPAIAHSRPSSKVMVIPPEEEARSRREEYQPPVAATRGCSNIFALLYTISKTAPPNYDFPLTRQALKGHTEFSGLEFIEAESLGKRYFGVMARNYEEGVKIVDVIRQGVKGSSPVLLCRKPHHVTRQIRFDLRTGNLLP